MPESWQTGPVWKPGTAENIDVDRESRLQPQCGLGPIPRNHLFKLLYVDWVCLLFYSSF